tara:strand:- start:225 stop:878 length:654 start_codon:yes stop_codon:yes gene_type:complete
MSDPQQNNAVLSATTNMKDNLKKNSVVAISSVTFITSIGLILAHLAGGVKGTVKPSLFFSLFGLFLLMIKLIQNITKKNKSDNEKGLSEPNLMKKPSIIFLISSIVGLAPIALLYIMLYNVKINDIIQMGKTAPEGRTVVKDNVDKSKMDMYKSFIMIVYGIILLCMFMITVMLIAGMKLIKKFQYIPLVFSIVAFIIGAIIYRYALLQIKFYSTTD